jgi:hypothetical protein
VANAVSIAVSNSAGVQVRTTWPEVSSPRWASGTVVVDSVIELPSTCWANSGRCLSRAVRAAVMAAVSSA